MRRLQSFLLWIILLPALAACSGPIKTGTTGTSGTATVTLSPTTVNVKPFMTQQFSATVSGTTNTAVNWQVNGVTGGSQQTGFISTAGLYVAPGGVPVSGSNPTTVMVTAVSAATGSSGSSTVTVVPNNQAAQNKPIELGSSGGSSTDSITNGNAITCCGGTLGSLVTMGGTQYILSNNHVLAKRDTGNVGDAIIQPALIDNIGANGQTTCAATGTTTVANLSQFFNLETGGGTKIDAAIAQIVSGAVDASGNILYLGSTTDGNGVPVPGPPHMSTTLITPTIGEAVAKSGRTTGLTCSTVLSTSLSVSVNYTANCDGSGTQFTVNYINQIDVTGGNFSAAGDSGSLIVDQNSADPIALLYGGNTTDTVGNPVADVLNFFQGNSAMTFVGSTTTHKVIGCTLPTKPASATQTLTASAVSSDAMQKALTARDAHAPELMGHPEVQAVGVGASYDNPAEGAILFFVTKDQPHTDIPQQVDGVRTRIIEGELFAKRGTISAEDSSALEQSVAAPQVVYPISEAEASRAKTVHANHVDELMKQPGVQGVGITSSVDSPGEAALMIFLIQGATHNPIPPVIDGLRTRVRETSRFKADFGGMKPRNGGGCSVPAKTSATRKLASIMPSFSFPAIQP